MQKIVLFTSTGGGGHMAASNALAAYLKDDYEITQTCLLADILKSFDPILFATFGKCSGEATYNAITPYNQWWLLNLIYRLGRIYFAPLEPLMRKKIVEYLKATNADMVISVIPIFNKVILQAAEELDIPFLLVPTDLDIRSFTYNIHYPRYKKFHLSLIFDDTSIKNNAYSTGLDDHFITNNGFPLRSEFFEEKNRTALRASFQIKQDMPVVMIMMGSQGANSFLQCVTSLQNLQVPIHLLVCIGKYQGIKEPMTQISLPPWVTMDIIEETNHISDYMAVADLLITKSGTATFCEAIHMGLPMVIDATSASLIWERFNHRFTAKHDLGSVIKNYDELPLYITQFFQNQTMSQEIKHNMSLLRVKDAPGKIKARVARMLRPAYQWGNLMVAYSKKSRFE